MDDLNSGCKTRTMNRNYKWSDFAIPATTSPVLLSSSMQPPFMQNSTKFLRTAFIPTTNHLVSERFDPKDRPNVYNYNTYHAKVTSTGTTLSRPLRTNSTFIQHHLSRPSTWFDSLSYLSTAG